MNRLTNKKLVDLKYGEFISIPKEEYRKQVHEAPTYKEIYTKLGHIEDLMEKYELEDLVELEIALDQYFHRADNVQTRRVDSNE